MNGPAPLPGRRVVLGALGLGAVITAAYWVLWYADRGVVASNHRAAYYEFENAFPLADGWLVVCLLAALVLLMRHSPTALLWLIAAGGSAVYLACMDVLYDIEQSIWWRSGAGGWIELVINVLTLALGVLLLTWSWRHRRALQA